jgi:hypothetical protein
LRLARAAYKAAVCPEQPEPMMTTSRVSLIRFLASGFRLPIVD